MNEKTMTIRIDADLYKKIKVEVAERGITLKEYIVSLIEADLSSKKQ